MKRHRNQTTTARRKTAPQPAATVAPRHDESGTATRSEEAPNQATQNATSEEGRDETKEEEGRRQPAAEEGNQTRQPAPPIKGRQDKRHRIPGRRHANQRRKKTSAHGIKKRPPVFRYPTKKTIKTDLKTAWKITRSEEKTPYCKPIRRKKIEFPIYKEEKRRSKKTFENRSQNC